MTSAPPFHLAALDLRGRRVLVVGAGRVATRRLQRYLEARALVEVVAPEAGDEVRRLAASGDITWHRRRVEARDVEGAWFVMTAADDQDANALVAAECERRHIFCVRADHADGGTARTPTYLAADPFGIGIIGHRDPAGSRAVRRRIAEALGVDED